VNKRELVARLARETSLTKADANRLLDAFVEMVTRTLKKGDKVTLVGFGTFSVRRHRARSAWNPRAAAPMRVAGRRLPKFTPGKDLKKAVK